MFTMKILFLLLLFAGCAVKCDNTSNNYYVIDMPSDVEDQTSRDTKKPYTVYWNVPTIQCKSKKIPFENLYEKYGIIQNSDDKFLGEKIAILYDPGLFPALLTNEPSGKLKFRNGGVPQEGDLEKHLFSFRNAMDQSVPDPDFNGVGIIDFESWRPVFRQNFGVLSPYQDVSIEIERAKHWWWSKEWIKEEARLRFEEAARSFMQSTLSLARQMRPKAVWGYYGFPYCFNMATNNMAEECARVVPKENDHLGWLWADSAAVFPSVYSSRSLSGAELAALVRGRVREALRVRRGQAPVLPYFWYRYREGGLFSEEDLNTALKALYNTNSSGFIIWGSSKDVNTTEKCKKLYKYVDKVLGPAVAKYTKHRKVIEPSIIPYMANDTVLVFDSYTTVASTGTNEESNKTMELDPEFHWTPPENYTQDIKEYVNDFMKFTTEVTTKNPFDGADNNVLNINNTNLIDIIMGTNISDAELYRNDNITSQDEIIKDENVEEVVPVCLLTTKSNTATVNTKGSAVQQDLNTASSEMITERLSKFDVDLSMQETSTVYMDATKFEEKHESTVTTESYFPFNEENLFDSEYITNIESSTNMNTENEEVNITNKLPTEKSEISETTVGYSTDVTTSTTRHNYIEDTTINLSDVTEKTTTPMTIGNLVEILDSEIDTANNKSEEGETNAINVDGDRLRDLGPVTNPISSKLSSAVTSFDKAIGTRSSSTTVTERRYIICVFLSFYSVAKCLCEVYGQCAE